MDEEVKKKKEEDELKPATTTMTTEDLRLLLDESEGDLMIARDNFRYLWKSANDMLKKVRVLQSSMDAQQKMNEALEKKVEELNRLINSSSEDNVN